MPKLRMGHDAALAPGWLGRQLAACLATLDALPPALRQSMNQPTTTDPRTATPDGHAMCSRCEQKARTA